MLCACGEHAAPPTSEADRPPADPAHQQVVDLWRVYQQATRLRVAGDVAAALAHYDSALALNPDHGDALYHSGGVAFQLGDFAEAESRWRRLLAVDDCNARAHVQLGALYSCGLPGAPFDLTRAREEAGTCSGAESSRYRTAGAARRNRAAAGGPGDSRGSLECGATDE
jgi:tetratricopeptide (TPR) repeat protein